MHQSIQKLNKGEKILYFFQHEPERLGDICHFMGFNKALKNDPCVYCGEKSDSFEHVVPHHHGGKDANNRVGACAKCNNDRKAKPFLIWMIERRKNELDSQHT